MTAPWPLTPELDAGLHSVVRLIGVEHGSERRVLVANDLIRARLAERPLTHEQLLANAIVDHLTAGVRNRAGIALADFVGVSERAVQRAPADPDLARLAVELGYFDQAHLVNDFRRAAGVTPSAYRRSLRDLAGN